MNIACHLVPKLDGCMYEPDMNRAPFVESEEADHRVIDWPIWISADGRMTWIGEVCSEIQMVSK